MLNLIYKDLKLGINPFFYFLPVLFGALMLIPGWLYFFVFLYFCFVTTPNMFANFKVQNDMMFSVMMPVRKKDIVLSRMITITILELLHIAFAAIFALINKNIYDQNMFFFLKPNIAFFALGFVLYGLFNLVLFPIFFKSGYKYGVATILGIVIAIIFAAGIELLAFYNQNFNQFMSGISPNSSTEHILLLIISIIFFAFLNWVAYKLSLNSFKMVDV